MIPAPVILLPTKGLDYTTDIADQTISGTTSTDTKNIYVNGSTYGVSYTTGSNIWSWSGKLSPGVNTLNIVAIEKQTGLPSPAAIINITLIKSETFITVSPPTGVKLRSYQNKIEVLNVKNPEAQTIGYNYYVSTQSGGGPTKTYTKMNLQIVDTYSFYEDNTRLLNESVEVSNNIKVTTKTEELTRTYYYSYSLDADVLARLISNGFPSVTLTEDQPFFFVVTAVIYDPVLGQVTESAYSVELQGSPIVITTGVRKLPERTQNNIVLTFSRELLTGNKNISTLPGTVVRDLLDPISEEIARVYVIQDFLACSLSVSALLNFDDANGDGISDTVQESIPKQALKAALGLNRDIDLQNLIDNQFDMLASNVNVIRRGAAPAIGTVIYYLEREPIRDMIINQGAVVSTQGDLDNGIPAQSYLTLESKILSLSNKDQFFNPQTNRYEVPVQVQALTSGSSGNTDAYTIVNATSGADSDFSVENPNPISFGQDRETNRQLATRIQLAMFADTGTTGGYYKVAAGVPGVQRVDVEGAGAPLMIRDYDNIRDKHIGGKVDIYIQGERVKQVTDQIAFSFESIGKAGTQTGEIFAIINVPAYEFKSQNPRVSAHTPIFEVTRVYNYTRLKDYDITGYQIIGDGDTIKLDETIPLNQAIGLASADIVKVDYKFRSSDTYVLKNQPVLNIVSVIGQISGPLTPDNYELVSLQDPLANGRSTISSDSVRIKFANGLPLEEFQSITDESHVMILDKEEALNFIGADPESIIVRDINKVRTYQKNVDYRIIPGTETIPTKIIMLESGSIANGQEVLISYTAIENFIVTYTTNDLLRKVQDEINVMKHACADVIVKQAIENKVDFSFTVVPKANVTNTALLTSKIRTALSNYISQLSIGTPLTQSEVVHIVQSLDDVNYMVLPMARMVKADGSFIIRDDIGRTEFEIFHEGYVRSYITVTPVLTFSTMDKGGPENLFRGVFENKLPLVLQDDPLDVSGGAGRAYIQSDGRIIVSTRDGRLPGTKSYQASYYVYGEKGSKDITVASVEYLTVGSLTVSYDTPQG